MGWWQRVWRGSRLLTAFAQDRLLLGVTLGLVFLMTLPMLVSPFLPLADLPDNVGISSLLWQTATGQGLPGYHYKVNWAPLPYWTTHLIVASLKPLLGALLAAKVMVWISMLTMPLACMRALLALGRDVRLGLWAFILCWGWLLFAGWSAFLLGMNLGVWACAWLIEARTTRDALRIFLLSALVSFTHAQAALYLACMCSVLLLHTRRPWAWRTFRAFLACAAGISVVILPWMITSMRGGSQGPKPPFVFGYDNISEKIGSLYRYTLDNQVRPMDQLASALAFGVLLFGPILLASAASTPPPERDGWRIEPALAFFFVPCALYFSLPMSISGPISHTFTYLRYGTYMLAALLLMPRVDLRGARAWLLLPGVLCYCFFQLRVTSQLSDYSQRSRPFLTIIDHVAPNSSYLPLELDDTDPVLKLDPYNQIHAYIAAVKGGFDPHLFDYASIPLLYRSERRPPQTEWNAPGNFSMRRHGQYYDYVLVQGGLHMDPVKHAAPTKNAVAKLEVEAGRFRLYRIEKRGPNEP